MLLYSLRVRIKLALKTYVIVVTEGLRRILNIAEMFVEGISVRQRRVSLLRNVKREVISRC